MKDKPTTMTRRRALGVLTAAVAVAPVGSLVGMRSVMAADLPKVAESDPTAVGLSYKHDATQASRVDKAGTPAAEQFCKNCQFAQGEGDWVPCSIFPGKAVAANGWCSAWARKAG